MIKPTFLEKSARSAKTVVRLTKNRLKPKKTPLSPHPLALNTYALDAHHLHQVTAQCPLRSAASTYSVQGAVTA